MPIYEYRCEACGHEMEALQKISEAALTDCPECGRSQLKKLISAAGFQLKGSGWYATDFKDQGKKGGNGKKKADSDSSSSSGADTKAGGGCAAGKCGCAGH